MSDRQTDNRLSDGQIARLESCALLGDTQVERDIVAIVDEVRALRQRLAEVEGENAEYRALFEVKSLQRSLDEAREESERTTAEAIASWLEDEAASCGGGRSTTGKAAARAFLQAAADIRNHVWKVKS